MNDLCCFSRHNCQSCLRGNYKGNSLNDSITGVRSGSVTINTTYVTSVGDNGWRIQNGVATVYVGNILFKKTQNNAQVFSGLPRARVQVGAVISSSSYQNNKALYTSGDCLWIPTNSTSANAHIGTGMLNVGIWAYFTYLTSD